jgi:hypothetical protein
MFSLPARAGAADPPPPGGHRYQRPAGSTAAIAIATNSSVR